MESFIGVRPNLLKNPFVEIEARPSKRTFEYNLAKKRSLISGTDLFYQLKAKKQIALVARPEPCLSMPAIEFFMASL